MPYSPPYSIRFDFDAEGEPPKVLIVDEQGYDIAQIFEAPTIEGGELVKVELGVYSWEGKWSWLPSDWKPGVFARKVLTLLNAEEIET